MFLWLKENIMVCKEWIGGICRWEECKIELWSSLGIWWKRNEIL